MSRRRATDRRPTARRTLKARSTAAPRRRPRDDGAVGQPRGYDRDAGWLIKTRKGGGDELCFGYEVQLVVRTPDPHQDGYAEPALVERLEVTSSRRDTIPASQRLLARIPERGGSKRLLVADRAYNNWREENWFIPLTEMGFEQVVDMRETHRGRRPAGGMVWIDGSAHCPRIPEGMEGLRAPQIGSPGRAWEQFHDAIDRRAAYAARWHTRGLKARVTCPALGQTPTVGCARREGTIELAHKHGLPIIDSPPKDQDAPALCTQSAVSVTPEAFGRNWQKYYWGSREWRRAFKRRTRVEQVFGQAKSDDGEAMTRGFIRVNGLPRFNLAVTCIAVARNLKQLEAFAARHGDARAPGNPLLQADPVYVVLHVQSDELESFLAWRGQVQGEEEDLFAGADWDFGEEAA